jgi:hypothetical protein
VQHFPSGSEEVVLCISDAGLVGLIRELEGESGSVVEVGADTGDNPRLIVAIDLGRFMVTAVVGSDEAEYYDRVGDPSASGQLELVVGGQRIDEVPARFVLSRQQVEEVVAEFITTKQWALSQKWVKQGPGPWE